MNETLVVAERAGVEIDYCPRCRGVWLDRGEINKIVEGSSGSLAPEPNYRGKGSDERSGQRPHKNKKESFFSELFDF